MTATTSPSKPLRWLGAVLGILAGVWGVGVSQIFISEQLRLVLPGMAISNEIVADFPLFFFFGLHGLGYAASGIIALLAGANRVRNIFWLWPMLVFAVAMIRFTVVLYTNVGLFPLPAAVGLLAGSLVLLTTLHIQDSPHSGRTK